MSAATIQAAETDEGTVYVLRRPGLEPVSAYWPHPLLELEPDAARIATLDPWPSRSSTAVPVTPARGAAYRDDSDQLEHEHWSPSIIIAREPRWATSVSHVRWMDEDNR